MNFTTSHNAPLMPAIQQLRDELKASEVINQMKELEIEELQERVWRAEAALADCERELSESKILVAQANLRTDAKDAELKRYVMHAAFGDIGALIKELYELRMSYDLLHLAHHGYCAGVADAVASRNDSPVSPLHLPWAMPDGNVAAIPGAPPLVKTYSFGEMIEALRKLHPEPVAPMPTRVASSSSA